MSRIRGKDTAPELHLRRALSAIGMRYRVHSRSVPGTPDISHKGVQLAVFVDGCFWHGCPKHYKRPKSHHGFWERKLAYNKELRLRVKSRLQGWKVIEVWECNIRQNPERIARRIQAAVDRRR